MAEKTPSRSFVRIMVGAVLATLCACGSVPRDRTTAQPTLQGESLDELAVARRGAAQPPLKHPRLGITLGGGGLRGYALLGVLAALDEQGVRPDIVVGTSVGAIVGAGYASGKSPQELWRRAEALRMVSLADPTLSGPGFVKGEALARWMDELVDHVPIQQFPKTFAAVASDLDHGRTIVLSSGDAGQAVRASAAIPGVFLPVEYAGGRLVDGGVTSLVPVDAAHALGADVVIAVDIYCHGPRYAATTMPTTWLRVQQLQSCRLSEAELSRADVVIAPAVAPAGIDDSPSRRSARQVGFAAALAAIPEIEAALARATVAGSGEVRR
jgi:NTE family protein